ncbi:DNA-binding NarL/FixJ family response regulator [Chitinophaga terrae (ex Kim and Jung 2007)]|uniref:response regulator n=1 Tax=Chitinophaga terrae (ex Kim and Jung 2007) TaxID=408074 RepID=UPI0027836CA8|nr:response regulator transcription factor [Chitinophaga terrae (ex Kim and Jung 2007)]MDQ0110408.1 DNA-binding NarL/FixJ family response regulator [Chitinophaga terrae (ex Kim and Jung 2007)]
MPIRVAITDDHPLVINGLQTMLAEMPDVEVLFTTLNGSALLEQLQQQQPDILLLDIVLPDTHGTELTRQVLKQFRAVKIIALTNYDNSHLVRQMLRNGASGYLLKNTDMPTLATAIRKVNQGQQFIDPQLEEALVQEAITRQKSSKNEVPLTKRETEVLQLIAEELSSQEISERLSISPRTAEKHRSNIIQKLGIRNVAGLVKEAYRRGLI